MVVTEHMTPLHYRAFVRNGDQHQRSVSVSTLSRTSSRMRRIFFVMLDGWVSLSGLNQVKLGYVVHASSLSQADPLDVILQSGDLLVGYFDSLSEGEIIPLSGVSKSGACCIIHAGGAGGWACGGELQLASASGNITLQISNLAFRIFKLLRSLQIDISYCFLCFVLPPSWPDSCCFSFCSASLSWRSARC